MLSWKKNACCCESCLSYPSITLIPYVNHNPCIHHVFYWGRGFLTCVLFTSARRRAKVLLLTGVHIALPTRSVSDSPTRIFFSPAARGCYWFLLTLTLLLQPWFLDTCGTKKIFLLLWLFLDTWVPHVHFIVRSKRTWQVATPSGTSLEVI
jgi:hypothetical protein